MQAIKNEPTIEEAECAISEFVESSEYSAKNDAGKMDAGELLGLIVCELEKCTERQKSLLRYAKEQGFEPKNISKILRLKKQDPEKISDDRRILRNYATALGLNELAEVL